MPDEIVHPVGSLVDSGDEVKADGQMHKDQIMQPGSVRQCQGIIQDCVSNTIMLLSENGFTGPVGAKINAVLTQVSEILRANNLMAGVTLCDDLSDLVEKHPQRDNHLAIEVLQDAFNKIPRYLDATLQAQHDVPWSLLWTINDVRVVSQKPLITESVYSLPADYSAATSDKLVSVVPAHEGEYWSDRFYASFSATLASVYSGNNRKQDLEQLAEICRASVSDDTHEYAAIFWFSCSVFITCIDTEDEVLTPAIRYVLRQIDLVIKNFVVDTDTLVLSVEGIDAVERVLCNMLCFIAVRAPDDPIAAKLEQQFDARKSLQQSGRRSVAADGVLLVSTIQSSHRLIARTKLAIDAAVRSGELADHSVSENLACIKDACALLVCTEGFGQVEKAARYYHRYINVGEPLSDRDACATSIMLAEQAMLDQFPVQLAADKQGLAGQLSANETQLDDLLLKELLKELKPLANESVPEDEPCVGVSVEWLQAVLLDVVCAAAFLSDTFLYDELAPLKADAVALLSEERRSFLLQLAMSVDDYLSAYAVVESRFEAQEHVHVSCAQLQDTLDRSAIVPKDIKTTFADIASENNQILESAQSLVAEESNQSLVHSAVEDSDRFNESPHLIESEHSLSASVEFGNDCNTQVDIIQHALDTALGSSGNLSPDKTVITALENLRHSVEKEALEPLLRLIDPLSQILVSAESSGSTLSQSDTLLVQEAIVAITLGVDALVNGKPMSELVADVTQRMTAVALDGRHNLRGDFESAGLVDVFVEEAEELLQRLFELFQRWRGAPQGSSRIHHDISRLLHTLKGSADTVGLNAVATLVHHLESVLAVVQNDSGDSPGVEFFDLALETVESLSDDIDRIRNSEQIGDRADLVAMLQARSHNTDKVLSGELVNPAVATPAVSSPMSVRGGNSGSSQTPGRLPHELLPADRAPAFGSAKYYQAMEMSERLIKRHNNDVLELHSELQNQVTEMRSTLQSTRYLLAHNSRSGATAALDKSLNESLSDLEATERSLNNLMRRIESTDDKQKIAIQELTSLVSAADIVAVESIRVRMESIVQKSAETSAKRVKFIFHGTDLELERKLFSDLLGPLEQLLNNAVVHGIESSSTRALNRKAEYGSVTLSFKVVAETLTVIVSDDGAGIDMAEVRRRLAIYPEFAQTASLSDSDVLKQLVMQGVSTAAQTDRTSGRGVGLDVVLQRVYSHKGTLAVTTSRGEHTDFTITIPLRSVPCHVLVIRVAGLFYAIDCADLVEVQNDVEAAPGLATLLGSSGESFGEVSMAGVSTGSDSVVLSCRSGDQVMSFRVDSVIGRRTINFNRHDPILNSVPWCSGSAMFEGRDVLLRLDVSCLKTLTATVPTAALVPSAVDTEVLIVDDSVTIRASFGRAMTTAGHKIHLARNGIEASDYLRKNNPAVIILDLEMPHMNGFELAAFIRAERRLDQSKLLVVTSRPRNEIADWLASVKAEGYFEKPCAEDILAESVAGLLASPSW